MKYRKLRVVTIREELFAITGNTTQAIILGQLMYWTDRVRYVDEYIKEEVERLLQNKQPHECDIPQSNGWIYKKSSEIIEECLIDASQQTVRRYLTDLENKGFISSRRNPKIKYDRTLQYRVNFKEILCAVREAGYYGLSGYIFSNKIEIEINQNLDLNNQKDNLNLQNGEAIPEITNIDYKEDNISFVENENDNDFSTSSSSSKQTSETIDDFVIRMYAYYPSKCPKRGMSTGKCSKDKDRIRKLLKTYSMEQIDAVFKHEIDSKYGIAYLSNFSTFLNNFPDPDECLSTKSEEVSEIKEKDVNNIYKW